MPIDKEAGLSAAEIISLLDLRPHPEGGHFRQTFKDSAQGAQGRAASTLIYFLLEAGQISQWHRVDAAEVWHFYAGAPLQISVSRDGEETSGHVLGNDLSAGQRPQFIVPAHWWQSAWSLGAWTLVGCSVAPGFEFSGFDLAPPGWRPGSASG
ncbi:cupin domain-containing protein [Methylocapsa polymorpha]|uniref:Cupin domain-containing protein n=1 Tax=Methylocapsa polymorpha TaxID=3080828 RepID=A0ABZ0HU22_9HYPH|nr:cupin domain-containing protein [Methylocapsa sp. RX1]